MALSSILGIASLGALALLLVSAGIEDIRHREIANGKTLAVACLAPLWWFASGLSLWPDVAIQLALAFGVFAVFAAAFHFGVMGGGDVKLIGALALWLPFGLLVWTLIVMSLAGGAVTIVVTAVHRLRRNTAAGSAEIQVPYGVAIAIAGLIAIHEPLLNQISQ